jgi:hypothetical protein
MSPECATVARVDGSRYVVRGRSRSRLPRARASACRAVPDDGDYEAAVGTSIALADTIAAAVIVAILLAVVLAVAVALAAGSD